MGALLVGKSWPDHVGFQMLRNDFVEEPIYGTSNGRNQVEDRRAVRLTSERPLDRLHLTANALFGSGVPSLCPGQPLGFDIKSQMATTIMSNKPG